MGCVYLLHFTEAVAGRAQHYVGYTDRTPDERLADHVAGRGGRLPAAAVGSGFVITVARVWPDVARAFERRLKRRKNHRQLCPHCRAAYLVRRNQAKQRRAKDVAQGD